MAVFYSAALTPHGRSTTLRTNSFSIDKKKASMRDTLTSVSPAPGTPSTPKSGRANRVFGASLEDVMIRERERDPNALVPRVVKEGFTSHMCLFSFPEKLVQ